MKEFEIASRSAARRAVGIVFLWGLDYVA